MEYPLTDDWFVLRDLTRPNAKRPAYRLLEEKGIEIFTAQSETLGDCVKILIFAS